MILKIEVMCQTIVFSFHALIARVLKGELVIIIYIRSPGGIVQKNDGGMN